MAIDSFECRCCLSKVEKGLIYKVKSGNSVFNYLGCSICGSFTVINSNENFGYDDLMNAAGIEHYIEIGAGIDFMVELLNPLIELGFNAESRSYLELGCGFGFLTSYASFMGFGKVIGVEDANYGKIGSEVLGFECQKLSDFELQIGEFDVVLASEVIEHVNDTKDFLENVKDRLMGDGIFVLTTPNAEFINQANIDLNDSLTLAALSPGFHTCLFSPQALREMLVRVGFKNIEIVIRHERLVAYASNNLSYKFNLRQSVTDKESYLNYLTHLTKSGHTSVQVGSNLRIFKELVNRGELDFKINEIYDNLLKNLGSSLLEFGKEEVRLGGGFKIDTLEDYRRRFRFHEGVLTFYASQYERNLGRPGMQIALLEKAISVIDREASYAPEFFQESSSLRAVALERLDEALSFMNQRYLGPVQVAPALSIRWLSNIFGRRRQKS